MEDNTLRVEVWLVPSNENPVIWQIGNSGFINAKKQIDDRYEGRHLILTSPMQKFKSGDLVYDIFNRCVEIFTDTDEKFYSSTKRIRPRVKVVATTNPAEVDLGYPRIQDLFIMNYVKAYIDNNIIWCVKVETISSCNEYYNPSRFEIITALKLDKDGCVIIHPVNEEIALSAKEKSYTRKEVLEVLKDGIDRFVDGMVFEDAIESWFNETYPQ